jgi:hypothetical protein
VFYYETSTPQNGKTHQYYAKKVLKIGKAIPLQAWTGPEGSGKLRFPDFKTIGT